MRLWSIHPQYLDVKGLGGLWREALLAQKVLQGQTKGYKHHPQLDRFKATPNPIGAIADYLRAVLAEAEARGYNYDGSKIAADTYDGELIVAEGQINHERRHLLAKLWDRDRDRHGILRKCEKIALHPMFTLTAGGIADWERAPSLLPKAEPQRWCYCPACLGGGYVSADESVEMVRCLNCQGHGGWAVGQLVHGYAAA